MGTENPTFQIPKDVIEPIIQANVSAAVAAALLDRSQIVEYAVSEVLNAKVDSNGQKSSYGNSVPWIQWVMQDAVKNSVKEAIKTELGKHEAKIKEQIKKELGRTNSPLVKALVDGMVGGLVKDSRLSYDFKVEVKG